MSKLSRQCLFVLMTCVSVVYQINGDVTPPQPASTKQSTTEGVPTKSQSPSGEPPHRRSTTHTKTEAVSAPSHLPNGIPLQSLPTTVQTTTDAVSVPPPPPTGSPPYPQSPVQTTAESVPGLSPTSNGERPHPPPTSQTTAEADFIPFPSASRFGTSDIAPPPTTDWYYDYTFWLNKKEILDDDFSAKNYIMNICPNVHSCNVTSTTHTNTTEGTVVSSLWSSCCLPCSCSDDCFTNNNCCFDKELPQTDAKDSNVRPEAKESCVNPIFTDTFNPVDLPSADRTAYVIVNHCDASDKSNDTISNCQDYDTLDFDAQTPMFSRGSRISFRNQLCAVCNGEFTYLLTPWETILSCTDYDLFMAIVQNATLRFDLLTMVQKEDRCVLKWRPPTSDFKPCFRADKVTMNSTCIATDDLDPKSVELCNSLTMPFGNPQGIIYKNMFCFGCNNNYMYDYYADDQLCFSYDFLTEYPFEGYIDRDILYVSSSFNENSDKPSLDQQSTADTMCSEGYNFSQVLGICFKSICAPSKVRVNGRCVQALKLIKGLDIEYRIEYRIPIDGTDLPSKYDMERLVQELVDWQSRVYRFTGFSISSAFLADRQVMYSIVVKLSVIDFIDLENVFENVISSIAVYPVEYVPHFTVSNFMHMDMNVPNFVRFKESGAVAMTYLQFCDAVIFQFNETMVSVNGKLTVNRAVLDSSQYLVRSTTTGDKYAQICEETLHILEQDISTKHVRVNGANVLLAEHSIHTVVSGVLVYLAGNVFLTLE